MLSLVRNASSVLVAIALLAGCKLGIVLKTPLGPDVDKGELKDVNEMAVQETGCTSEPMAYSYIGGRLHSMEGCEATAVGSRSPTWRSGLASR